jgi:DNA (cytosine-5)-methyltransferase 1
MAEIAALPWNGIAVASTFSGAGGSCLGYRMAGCRVLWANEFVPAAQQVYKANHPGSVLNTDDLRTLSPEQIMQEAGVSVGELDILDGSPPCAAFSQAGRRTSTWGRVKQYSDTEQRVDDLFFEYARVLRAVQPRAFVAENVTGLIRGKAKGYFRLILHELRDCGYQVRAKVLDASWLGAATSRKRLIFIGMRNDQNCEPEFPRPLPYRYTLADAVSPEITGLIIGDPGVALAVPNAFKRGVYKPASIPCPTIQTSGIDGAPYKARMKGQRLAVCDETGTTLNKCDHSQRMTSEPSHHRMLTLGELRRVSSFPADFQLAGTYHQRWERIGRAVPPMMMKQVALTLSAQLRGGAA